MIQNATIVGHDISPERYNVEEAQRGSRELVVRSHMLTEVLRNAQRWVRGYSSPETKAKKWGTLLDCLLLTPKQYSYRYCVLPEDAPRKPSSRQIEAKKPSPATVEAIAWWKSFRDENPGEIIDSDQDASVHEAVRRLREDKLISELLDTSVKQVMVTAEWADKSTGLVVPLKCLIDVLPDPDHPTFGNSAWDTKTTANASPRSFSRDAQRYSYHLQGAFYLDMLNAATGQNRSDFGHIVLENYAPYEYRTPPPLLSQRFLDHGRLTYKKALGIYCRALASGDWPSYDAAGQSWPITDCEDWYLAMDTIYEPMAEPEEEEPMVKAPEEDVIP